MPRTSLVEFRPVMASALADGKGTREAIDVVIDGQPMSEALDVAPLDRVAVQSMPQAQWFNDGELKPLVCQCGDPHCTDVATRVRREGPLVSWTLPNGQTVTVEAESATTSLRAALSE